MSISLPRRFAPFAGFAAFALLLAACGKSPTHEFTTETPEVALGAQVVDVRLKNIASGSFVEDAVITATRLDMAPDGMQSMSSTIEPRGTAAPGVYRFNAKFRMAGRWALALSAKVPGQSDPIEGTVIFTAK
jgi:hypothetical protein